MLSWLPLIADIYWALTVCQPLLPEAWAFHPHHDLIATFVFQARKMTFPHLSAPAKCLV